MNLISILSPKRHPVSKGQNRLIALLILTFVVSGCLFEEEESSNGTNPQASSSSTSDDPMQSSSSGVILPTDGQLVSLYNATYTVDAANKIMVTRYVDKWCDDTEYIEDVDLDSLKYQVSNGQLLIWEDGDCAAMSFSGGSSSLQGTWTFESINSIPTGTVEPNCNEVDSDFEDMQIVIGTNTFVISAGLCPAELMISDWWEVSATQESCNTIVLDNGSQTSRVTYTFPQGAGFERMITTFKYGSSTCTVQNPIASPSTCAALTADPYDQFYACIEASGFNLTSEDSTVVIDTTSDTSTYTDICTLNGYYGDGECDTFCELPDPDCSGVDTTAVMQIVACSFSGLDFCNEWLSADVVNDQFACALIGGVALYSCPLPAEAVCTDETTGDTDYYYAVGSTCPTPITAY